MGRYGDDRDRLLTQLQETGACTIPYEWGPGHGDVTAAIARARSKAYRLGKTLGVRVETAAGWHELNVLVVK